MSNQEKKNAAEQPAEKVMTKYDLKVQRRKEEKAREKRAKDVSTAVLVILLLALACFVLSFPIKSYLTLHQAYVTVGGEDITKVEFDYCYHTVVNNYVNSYYQYLSWFGLDVTKDLSEQMYSSTRSWKDYFEEMTIDSMRKNKALKADAQAKGFTADVSAKYDQIVEEQKKSAQEAGLTLNKFLQESFGPYATLARIKPYIEEALYVNEYVDKLSDDMTPDEAAVVAKYDADPKSYDSVDYRITQINADLPTEPTELADPVEETDEETSESDEETAYVPSEAEIAKAMEDARAKANDALALISVDGETVTGMSYSACNDTIRDWLFDGVRKEGSKTILEDNADSVVYVVQFINRYRDESATADVRILVADTEEEAMDIYGTWNSDGATEDAFIALANGKYAEYSVADDALLEGIAKDDDLYEELIDWIYAEGRKPGDCEIVTVTDVASFVIYYVGEAKPKWYNTIENDLLNEALNAYVDQIKETCSVSDPKGNLNYLVLEAQEKAAAEAAAASEAAESAEQTDTAEESESTVTE